MSSTTESNTLSLTLEHGTESFTIPGSLAQPTVLYFMRASICPQCNRHARELNAMQAELKTRGMDVIIIVPEGTDDANKVKTRNNLVIPVMAGNGAAHALAGLDKKFLGLIQVSGTIVVDTDGTILYKKLATNPENSFNAKEFQAYLASVAVK